MAICIMNQNSGVSTSSRACRIERNRKNCANAMKPYSPRGMATIVGQRKPPAGIALLKANVASSMSMEMPMTRRRDLRALASSTFAEGHATEHVLPAGRKLVHEGSPCSDLFVIHSGWLIAFRQLRDGRRHIQNFWLPGEVCGAELAVFRNAPFSVMTITDCHVSAIAPEVLKSYTGGDALNSLLCQTSIILRERMVSLGRRSAFLRVAYLLLELTLRQRKSEGSHRLLPLSQLEVADSTGLTSVYVNRLLGAMRASGRLEVSRRGIRLSEVETFSREVEFNPRYLGESFPACTLEKFQPTRRSSSARL